MPNNTDRALIGIRSRLVSPPAELGRYRLVGETAPAEGTGHSRFAHL